MESTSYFSTLDDPPDAGVHLDVRRRCLDPDLDDVEGRHEGGRDEGAGTRRQHLLRVDPMIRHTLNG
jgi:hypothetical protein